MFPMNAYFADAARAAFPVNEQHVNAMKNMIPNAELFTNGMKNMIPNAELFTNGMKNMIPNAELFTSGMKNMLPNNELFTNAVRTNLETQLAMMTALTTKAFESMEKVVDLNLNAGKASLEDSEAIARKFLSAKDPQEVVSLIGAQAQPTAAKAIAYSRQLAGIAGAAQAELTRITEEQLAEKGRRLAAFVDEVSKNAPAGSENAMAIMQTAIRNAGAGYLQLNKTAKQAAEAVESNMTTAVDQFSQPAERTASTTGRGRRR